MRTNDYGRVELKRLLSANGLIVVRRGYVAAPPPPGLPISEQRIYRVLCGARAAADFARTPSVFSHLTAAMALGCWIVDPPPVAHLTQQRHVTTPGSGEITIRRHSAVLDKHEIRVHGDVLITAPLLTAVQCALTERLFRALPILDSLLALGLPKADVLEVCEGLAKVRGIRRARRACNLATPKVHSPGESTLRAHCDDLGLPPCETLYRLDTPRGPHELDLAWPERKVAIEFDGAMKVAGLSGEELTQAMNEIAAREAALVASGWVILHLTWGDLLRPAELRLRLTRLVLHRAL